MPAFIFFSLSALFIFFSLRGPQQDLSPGSVEKAAAEEGVVEVGVSEVNRNAAK